LTTTHNVLQQLSVTRVIPATAETLFSAWTDPDELKLWWGPKGVQCTFAEIDLKVGGRYRIGNQLPDGSVLVISGEFELVDRPHRLTYTWRLDEGDANAERVSVAFNDHELGTELVVTHELIATPTLRDQHYAGWIGCLDGLESRANHISI